MTLENRTRENRVRRAAQSFGYQLKKSRKQSWNFDDQGEYMLVDASTNSVVLGSRFDASLDEVERLLT